MSEQTAGINAVKLDPHMAIRQVGDEPLKWLSPKDKPFHLAGFYWFEQDNKYRRLPAAPSASLPQQVNELANCTAGGQIRFRTNSSKLSIKVKLSGIGNMYHMTATGQCGFDCYIGEIGQQRYCSTTRFDHTKTEYESMLFESSTKRQQCITLYFPLYQGVEEIWIGVDPDAEVSEVPSYISDKRIVIYGTSITQGGCANRPGMAYPHILSRSIPLEFINLGFSGNGKGEPEVAKVISEIDNPALFVLDYEANVGTYERMEATLPEFIRILRSKHTTTPILVLSKIRNAAECFSTDAENRRHRMRHIQMEIVEQLRQSGDRHVHFLDGGDLLGEDFAECTVDGIHPTDLGFHRMAHRLLPVIQNLLTDVFETPNEQ
jgi:lysophospholipase L1-like esterase